MPGLDGLRALAVLAVIFYHLNLPWAMGGFYGVTLFFVLSGYLITDILLTERKNCGRIALGSFWLRRAKRLLPAVFMLLICVTIYVAIFRRDLLPDLAGDLLPASFYYSNWWFIFRNVSYFQAFNLQLLNHFWSLGVEEQFYIFWPLLLILILPLFKKGRILVVIALTLASALAMALLFQPGQDPNRVYYGTDTRAFSLLCGAVVAFIVPSTKIFNFQLAKLAISGAVALAGCMCIMVFSNEYSTFTYRGGMLLFSALCAVLILCAAHPDTWAGKFFSLPPLRSVGKISYGLYLWQYPIILLTEPAVNAGGIDPLRCVLQVALAIMLSTASYIFIEDPIRRSKSLRNANWKFFKRRMPTVTALPIVLI
ncbi:MAG: acyltransferase, partial [Oscillospiraceae bacterium]|nr:acyltransferase [Oscillospiraceae bacterium]